MSAATSPASRPGENGAARSGPDAHEGALLSSGAALVAAPDALEARDVLPSLPHEVAVVSGVARASSPDAQEAREATIEAPHSGDPWGLRRVVADLRAARRASEAARGRQCGRAPLPSREALVRVMAGLRAALFPAHFGPSDLTEEGADFFVGHTLDRTLAALHEQVLRGLLYESGACDRARSERRAVEVMRSFAAGLPGVRALLETDVRAAYEGDPAATSPDEAVFCYPGVTAIMHQRLAHVLYREGVPLIPRILTEIAHADTGVDIHPGAAIGRSFFIDHGTGVVIGETCVIGERVRLYQGVTLGAKSFPLDDEGHPIKGVARHPIVEDNVVIYAGATILGRVTIGRDSSVGGNVWLTRSVPPRSRVTLGGTRSEVFSEGSGI